MAWKMSGTYVANCSCSLVCPCPMDGPPTGPNGVCVGNAVFQIAQGNSGDVDLSGMSWALFVTWPSNFSAGNVKAGLVVDDRASDDQAKAIERIVSGQEGGPFAEMAPLFSEFFGTERAGITFSSGEAPSASVAGKAEVGFEPHRGPDGSPTTVKGAMFGFAPEYRIGKGSGSSNAFGLSFEPVYGEAAEYEYASEMAGEAHPRV